MTSSFLKRRLPGLLSKKERSRRSSVVEEGKKIGQSCAKASRRKRKKDLEKKLAKRTGRKKKLG